jgi:hypothetical protein
MWAESETVFAHSHNFESFTMRTVMTVEVGGNSEPLIDIYDEGAGPSIEVVTIIAQI